MAFLNRPEPGFLRADPQSGWRGLRYAAGVLMMMSLPLASGADVQQRLAHGHALFEYYQQNYLAAAVIVQQAQDDSRRAIETESGAPENKNAVADDAHMAGHLQLLSGTIALAYGMPERAHQALSAVAETVDDPDNEQHAVAQYYLALLAHQQGRYGVAQDYLANLSDKDSSKSLADAPAGLQADIALRGNDPDNDPDKALSHYERLTPGSALQQHTAYNLGLALSRAGRYEQADALYQQALQPGTSRRFWFWPGSPVSAFSADRQAQVHLAAGYNALDAGQPELAARWLADIPDDSPAAAQALLGYGWSYYQQHDYRNALAAWQTLDDLVGVDAANHSLVWLEAALSRAAMFERLGDGVTAAESYEAVARQLVLQRQALQSQSQPASILTAVDALVAMPIVAFDLLPGFETDWASLPRVKQQLKALATLLQLHQTNDDWLARLEVFDAMLAARQQRARLEPVARRSTMLAQQLEQLQVQQAGLETWQQRVLQRQDQLALLPPDDHKRWQRVLRARISLKTLLACQQKPSSCAAASNALPTATQLTKAQSSVRLFEGLLRWQAAQVWHDQRWKLQQRVSAIDGQVAEAQRGLRHLESALSVNNHDADLQRRLSRLRTALTQQQTVLADHYQQGIEYLAADKQQMLAARGTWLDEQYVKTQLAIARLYDDTAALPVAGLPHSQETVTSAGFASVMMDVPADE